MMFVLSGGANYVIIRFAPPLLFCNKEEDKHTMTYTKRRCDHRYGYRH
nr:MAG TPA: hypothetical protein [Caudoviricetes sp.]